MENQSCRKKSGGTVTALFGGDFGSLGIRGDPRNGHLIDQCWFAPKKDGTRIAGAPG